MTDKQIIIDGVDVSGCSWYTQGTTGMICADWHISNDCAKNPNCYYKQLKRKEQECEELKEHHYELEEKFLELNVKAYSNTLELDQLKQTLTEIKEIAEANKNYIYVLPSSFVAGDSLEFSFEFTKNILQKISECEM